MSEHPATPDPATPVRQIFVLGNRRAYGALEGLFAPDSLLDLSEQGLGTYQGPHAIRTFCEGWIEVYDDFELTAERLVDVGKGVVLTINRHRGRPRESTADIVLDNAWVFVCRDGLVQRWTAYNDSEDARTAAEALAEPRE